ncbi:MAG: PAS domain-containing protein [Methylibium sp.]|uniref:PAS domain-containing protein n=1 Tax=Methylibium sp. TaxID=2067992 RepID=UPI0017DD1639|nr:PAS domain-containing protein [Methylibium sp.]MBA3598545.1 PAS domain-containing protein [Methylibium sp.]
MASIDLQEFRRTQAALAASEERLNRVLRGANDGWWDWDLVRNELFYSPRWWSMLGYAPDELPNDDALWRRLLHPGDTDEVERVFGAALASAPDNYEVEFRLQHKAGHYVPILSRGHVLRDAEGRPVGVSGTNTDITVRKQAEAARRESEASQSALLESMTDGVFVAQDRRFVFANPSLAKMLGYTLEEFIGSGFERVVDPQFLQIWTERFEQRVGASHAQDEPLRHYEVRFLARDGSALWLELRASRIAFLGRPGVLGILRDIGERKRAEASLQAARQFAQATLDGLTAHICVLDEHGVVLSSNAAWRRFGESNGAPPARVGAGADYFAACESAQGDGRADAQRFAHRLREVIDGRRPRFEMAYPCETADGRRWFVAHVTRGSDAGPVRVIVAHEDITEQIEAEHRIANLNQRLAMAIEGAGYGVWEFELSTHRMLWDDRMLAIYGHTPESFDSSPEAWQRCLYPDDRERVDARFADLLEGRPVEHFQFRIVRASDGQTRHIEANGYLQRSSGGQAYRLVGMNRDITADKEAEAALLESQERWKFALEGARDGVWDWNMAAASVLFSQRCSEMLGDAAFNLRLSVADWRARMHPDDLPAADAAFDAYRAGAMPTFRCEQRLRHAEGHWVWLLTRGLIVGRDAAGEPLRMVGTYTDLTEHKAAEAAHAALEARLRETQKMEAIGTLAGGVAHDFNNVLAGILGNVMLARQDLEAGHPALTSLEQIHKAGLRARSLVQQILAFSRRQPQALLEQPLGPLVEETLSLLRATLPAAVVLQARLAPQPLHVRADATQMQQVLMNLCTNAWHALKGGMGRIEVGIDRAVFDSASASAGLAPGHYAHLWVSDDGCGIDAATGERIFEPFFTTKPVGQGTGLGLAVVHGIVTAHGGAITLESRVSQGSSFHLYFPLVEPEIETLPDGRRERVAAGAGEHVLYVDDDEIMVLTVERLLQRAGYRVSGYLDAREALAALRAQPQSFDLVVTDFSMPVLSGIDVAREVRLLRADLPVVISSGYITDELRAEAARLGVNRLLHKEHTVEELDALVHRILASPKA